MAAERFCGGGTDRGELQVSEGPQVASPSCEPLHEEPHAVGRGEDQPVVTRKPVDRGVELGRVGDRTNLDGWGQQNFGPELTRGPPPRGCLLRVAA